MKKYLIVIIIALLYLLFAIFIPNLLDNNEYIFLDTKTKWVYKQGEWSNFTPSSEKLGLFKLYNMKEVEFVKNANLYYVDGGITTKDKSLYDDNFMLAYKGKKKLGLVSYEKTYGINSSETSAVLKALSINTTDMPTSSKIVIDLDNDGEDETIYELYNSINYNPDTKLYYSVVCVKDGNTYTKLAYDTSTYSFYETNSVTSIIDFTNDGKYEIIIGNRGISFNEIDTKYSMYGLEDGKYVKLVSTE